MIKGLLLSLPVLPNRVIELKPPKHPRTELCWYFVLDKEIPCTRESPCDLPLIQECFTNGILNLSQQQCKDQDADVHEPDGCKSLEVVFGKNIAKANRGENRVDEVKRQRIAI
jgi:hypothetical protein